MIYKYQVASDPFRCLGQWNPANLPSYRQFSSWFHKDDIIIIKYPSSYIIYSAKVLDASEMKEIVNAMIPIESREEYNLI